MSVKRYPHRHLGNNDVVTLELSVLSFRRPRSLGRGSFATVEMD